jgi:hypothetical protein
VRWWWWWLSGGNEYDGYDDSGYDIGDDNDGG